MKKYYYRYKEIYWTGDRVTLIIQQFKVIKETPCGVWLEQEYGLPNRFILTNARKKFANPTIEEALESFKARKKRQIKILKAQLERAELALKADPYVGYFKQR